MNQQSKWAKTLEQLSDDTLSKTDSAVFKQYKKSLKEIKIEVSKYLKEYESLSFSKRLEAERLLNVGETISGILKANNQEVTKLIKDGTKQQAINGYQGTFYGLEGANKLNLSMSILNNDYIESLVNKPVNRKRFSTRLYQNTVRLAKTTTQSLIQGAIDGKGYAYVAKRITDQTEADYRRAMRIARTEGGRVQSETTQRAYNEALDQGVDLQKQWVASLDDKTRSSHAGLDGTIIDVDDFFESSVTGAQALGPRMFGVPGEDINCRCTTISIVDGYKPSLRVDKESGKSVQNMSYTEWLSYKKD